MKKSVTQIGLLGFGTVGKAVFDLLKKNKSWLAQKMIPEISVRKICVKDLKKDRGVDKKYFTKNYKEIVSDPALDIVVELMGDCPEALDAITLALKAGKSVVTANKAIMARHASKLFELAKKHGCEILFEASVGGGIPILRALREGLAANRIETLYGIINGTSNFILSKMAAEKADFETVLKEAQKLGYAEASPAADIDGHDAAYKLCILAMLCHGRMIQVQDIFCRGIRFITSLDIEMADRFGYVIKHLGISKLHGDEIETRVHPTMIKKSDPLASVGGALNAIEYQGNYVGDGMLMGVGAGGKATASAVVSDVMELVRTIHSENKIDLEPTGFLPKFFKAAKPKDILQLETLYYIRFSVLDKPNVLARITKVLGKYDISIKHLYQHGEKEEHAVPVIVFTHQALEKNVRAALKEIDKMDFVQQTTKIIRIEE